MIIKPSTYTGVYTPQMLKRYIRPSEKYLYIVVNNKNIAIKVPHYFNENILQTVRIMENRNVPLWKTSMDISMGKIPKMNETTYRDYYVQVLDEEDIENRNTFYLYDVVSL